MIESRPITSEANPRYREWLRLASSPRAVREQGRTLAEGLHLAQALLETGQLPQAVLVRRGADHPELPLLLERLCRDGGCYELPGPLYDRICPVENGVGLLLVMAVPRHELPSRFDGDVVYIDGVQDPGNAGAILRCAAAAGVQRVIASPGTASLWAPRTLRASMGANLRLQLHENVTAGQLAGLLPGDWLVAVAHSGESLWTIDLPRSSVGWIFGSEGAGPGAESLALARRHVLIPTSGAVESLNVAAAAAVCLFERRRRLQAP